MGRRNRLPSPLSTLEAKATGDVAYDVGTYKTTLLVGPGKTVHDTGKHSVILKRRDGEWKIAYLIFHSGFPQPPGFNSRK